MTMCRYRCCCGWELGVPKEISDCLAALGGSECPVCKRTMLGFPEVIEVPMGCIFVWNEEPVK
jgi:hypothetical protein